MITYVIDRMFHISSKSAGNLVGCSYLKYGFRVLESRLPYDQLIEVQLAHCSNILMVSRTIEQGAPCTIEEISICIFLSCEKICDHVEYATSTPTVPVHLLTSMLLCGLNKLTDLTGDILAPTDTSSSLTRPDHRARRFQPSSTRTLITFSSSRSFRTAFSRASASSNHDSVFDFAHESGSGSSLRWRFRRQSSRPRT